MVVFCCCLVVSLVVVAVAYTRQNEDSTRATENVIVLSEVRL